MMKNTRHRRVRITRARASAGPSLLLGSLLMIFVGTLLYVTYLFLSMGQSTLASLPGLPALALPQLVRSVPQPPSTEPSLAVLPEQPAPQPIKQAEPPPARRITVLVMGVDNRPDEPVARTDSIMVVTVNPATGSTGMMSLARDLWVHVSALNRYAKINTVHVWGELNNFPGGGPAMLKSTVSELVGYPVDYYVRMNFDGFRQIVDLMGGVDIDVPKAIDDPLYPDDAYGYDPLHIPAGRQHMDGKLALKYARTRHADSDYYRESRQQQVIVALKQKVTQPGALGALLPRIPGLAIAMANSIQTDMPVDKVISLARVLDSANLQSPTRVVVDNTFGTESTDATRGFVLTPDMVMLRAAAANVFTEATPEQLAERTNREKLQAESARVVVLNGSNEAGLASRLTTSLSTAGITVTSVGTADRKDYAETWLVTYGDAMPNTREALIKKYSITPDHIRSEPPSSDADLTLIVGADQVNATASNK
jgi:polyisoprenyl-teichoic acid--peptidoglycan teichoic acid transferase